MESREQNNKKTLKGKVIQKVFERQLCSIMNDTKWRELQSAIDTLPFPPPFQIKYVCEETAIPVNFDADVWYLGDWSDESLTPFYNIEWICVRPRYTKHRGKLLIDEIIDETQEFISVLNKFSIPFVEQNGSYIIYGYK